MTESGRLHHHPNLHRDAAVGERRWAILEAQRKGKSWMVRPPAFAKGRLRLSSGLTRGQAKRWVWLMPAPCLIALPLRNRLAVA